VLAALAASKHGGGIALGNRRQAVFLAQNPHFFGGRIGGAIVQPRTPNLADIATILFGEAVIPSADVPAAPQQMRDATGAVLAQHEISVRTATSPGSTPVGEAYKRLLINWLDTRTSAEELTSAVVVAQSLAQVHDLTPMLRKVVVTDGVQGQARGQAMVYLLQRNKKAELPFIKSQLKNETVVSQVYLGANAMGGANLATCEVRDMALALLVADSGQNIFEYGFETAPGNAPNPVANPSPTYAFSTDEARDRGVRKWAEWEAKHPIPAFEPVPKK
jgi:hypothetical protein